MKSTSALWSLTAEIVTTIAVVASLGYLALEVDANTQAIIGETHQNLLEILHERDSWIANEQFAAVVLKVEDNAAQLTDVELRQYSDWIHGKFNVCEHVFDRNNRGLISADHWAGWDAGCRALLAPKSAREVWSQRAEWFGPKFRAYYNAHSASYENAGR